MGQPKRSNADYFSHDADMRNDIKVRALRRKYGNNGYAVWCYILETLTNSDNFEIEYNETSKELLAADYDVTTEQLQEIIAYCIKIELLQLQDDTLYCEAHQRRLSTLQAYRIQKSETGKKAAIIKWERIKQAKIAAEKASANAMQTQKIAEENDANAMQTHEKTPKETANPMRFDAKVKESKEIKKENLEKKKNHDLGAIDSAYREIVQTWLEYKAERRESYKGDRSLQTFVKKLRELSGDNPQKAQAIIEQSMANNYSGIFELKGNYNAQRQRPTQIPPQGNLSSEDSAALSSTPQQEGRLGVGEWITEDGRRTYGTGIANIPMNTRPRPSEQYAWNAERQTWDILL